jgi:Aspartate-ammonia ligase
MSISFSDNPTNSLAENSVPDTAEHFSSPPDDPRSSKKADLAGPGIGDYDELEKILPRDCNPRLTPKESQKAIFHLKHYIEDNLCKELSLMMVEVPLIVDARSGVNDLLDRDGSRTPIQFHISNDYRKHPIDAQVMQAATKWKRVWPPASRMPQRRRHLHRHARRAQGLLPRPRPFCLRRPVELGTRHHLRAA